MKKQYSPRRHKERKVYCLICLPLRGRKTNYKLRILNDLLYKARACVGRSSGHINAFLEVDKSLHLNLAKIVGNPLVLGKAIAIQALFFSVFMFFVQASLKKYAAIAGIKVLLVKPDNSLKMFF